MVAHGAAVSLRQVVCIVRLSTSRWCAGQSALHSITYLLFYWATGGPHSLWFDCFPAPLPDGQLNRLGLVNFFGLLASVVLLALVLPAWPQLRRHCYHVFQRLHLPVSALFVLCCALHDLPILLFAVPGLSAWYIEWRSSRTRGPLGCLPVPRLLPAKARLLPGTSGPWVELTVDCGAAPCPAPRGQWVSVRVAPLGKEWHPLSVTTSATGSEQLLSVVVSARAGNWSQALAALAQPATSSFDVEVGGPYPMGGGGWSLSGDPRQPALLLLAGGTGVTGWLPTLAAAGGCSRRCHLVWCVQNEADYRVLAGRLPSQRGVKITVYVTRGRAETTADGPLTIQAESGEHATAAAVATAMATARPPHGRSLLTLVSLAAALVGLAVGYWGWMYVAGVLARLPPDTGWVHQTLAGYTVTRRCLPIGLIGFSMAVTTAACSRALAHITCASSQRCRPTDTEVGAVSPRRPEPQQLPLFTTVSSSAPRPSMPAPAPPQRGDSDWTGSGREADGGSHEVRMGRPDADALVLAAAAGLETQHLVVAVCGPAALVDAARNAVAGARKVCHGVRIEFSGSNSRW